MLPSSFSSATDKKGIQYIVFTMMDWTLYLKLVSSFPKLVVMLRWNANQRQPTGSAVNYVLLWKTGCEKCEEYLFMANVLKKKNKKQNDPLTFCLFFKCPKPKLTITSINHKMSLMEAQPSAWNHRHSAQPIYFSGNLQYNVRLTPD